MTVNIQASMADRLSKLEHSQTSQARRQAAEIINSKKQRLPEWIESIEAFMF